MLFTVLLTVLVLDCIFLSVVILLQAGKGGGLAAMGGGVSATEGILAGRQATTVLTRATWTGGSIFMVLAMVLSIMSSASQEPTSILQQDMQPLPGQTTPAPVLPPPVTPSGNDAGATPPGEAGGAGGEAGAGNG